MNKLFLFPMRLRVLAAIHEEPNATVSEVMRRVYDGMVTQNYATIAEAVDLLEKEGVIVSRRDGRLRRVRVTPRYRALAAACATLGKLLRRHQLG